ncbi:MAG: hypothetical protein ACREFY_05565 [Acetobacteraceae bacterium]
MMGIRSAAAEHDVCMPLFNEFLAFLREKLGAEDYQEAESLLHAAISPMHALRRNRERIDANAPVSG